jgi:hypothetical protein
MSKIPVYLRHYRPPDVRRNDRYVELDDIKKYYDEIDVIQKHEYLLVFPRFEDQIAKPSWWGSLFKTSSEPRITWREISYHWKNIVPGDDESKSMALAKLAEVWTRYTP